MTQTNETTRLILKYFFDHGIFAWRNNTTGIPLPDGRGFRPSAKKGVSDILALLPPQARFCAVEVKTGKDRLSPEQTGFLATVKRFGGVALVVKDFQDFEDQFISLVP